MNRSRERRRGRRDQEARARLAPSVEAGEATCNRCGLPILPGQEWDADHIDSLVAGGHPDGPRAPAHALKADCPAGGNRAAGNADRTAWRNRHRTRTREWTS